MVTGAVMLSAFTGRGAMFQYISQLSGVSSMSLSFRIVNRASWPPPSARFVTSCHSTARSNRSASPGAQPAARVTVRNSDIDRFMMANPFIVS